MNETILIADDDAEIRRMLSLSLQLEGYSVDAVSSGEQALRRVQEKPTPSMLVLDLAMPGIGGMETLRRLRHMQHEVPVLILSCLSEPETIVEALQTGASDYITKPFETGNFHTRVRRLMTGGSKLRPAVAARPVVSHAPFVAQNHKMLKIHETICQIAHTDVPVLIHGESGVGKEVVARAIIDASDRREKPFVKINCAALPSTLLESEMFGYERGAFTGAFNSKPGKFELADKGTIFLDEISEMSPSLQAKFLQVLQDKCFSRLGGKVTVEVDARVVAATNVNLKEALKSGAFREDLYYRLNVVNIHVPPLRERMDELEELVSFFLEKHESRFGQYQITPSERLMTAMRRYDWPGNVRELENVVRRYLVLGDADHVAEELENSTRDRFHKTIGGLEPSQDQSEKVSFTERVNDLKRTAESEAILKSLAQTNWNRKEAAKLLDISYKSFLYRMKVLGIGSR